MDETYIMKNCKWMTWVFIIVLYSMNQVNAQKISTHIATRADVLIDSVKKRIPVKSCNQMQSYVPDSLHPEMTPRREVRVNFHVIQDGSGKNNFSEEEGRKFIMASLTNANNRLAANQKMLLPKDNNTPVLAIPYRFVLTGKPNVPGDDGIYFHRDDSLYSMNKRSKKKDNVFDKRQYDTYGVQKDSVINIFLIEHHSDSLKSPTYKASNDGVGSGPWAKMVGSYYLWKHPNITAKGDTTRFMPWHFSGLLNHELGHCLGLPHTWNVDDGCEDTPKHPGCWNYGDPPCEIPSNNVMDYNAFQNALTPCQIGKVCMNFFNEKVSRKYLVPGWCNYNGDKSITISGGDEVEWNRSVDVFGDLIIEDNATLTMRCIVSMPPGSKIILQPKATLILDGCTLTCRCDGQWDGIEIQTTKKSSPIIHLKNGATVEKVKNPLY